MALGRKETCDKNDKPLVNTLQIAQLNWNFLGEFLTTIQEHSPK